MDPLVCVHTAHFVEVLVQLDSHADFRIASSISTPPVGYLKFRDG